MANDQSEILVEADGLTKYYGNFRAIESVSFKVPRGSITAFLGPNGAGKSTTIRILTGYLAPDAGRAIVAGHDMASDRIAASRKLGYLSENGPLYPDMSPVAYLAYVGKIRNMGASDLNSALERVADSCRLREVWNKSIRNLSKGFRQRVGLAQAILHNPDVLILDEPTIGLDPNQIAVVRQLIKDYAQDKTVLLSTHILQEVSAMADQVVLISEGSLCFQGTPEELAGEEGMEARFKALTGGVAA